MRVAFLPAVAALLALAACEVPQSAAPPISAQAARGPEPRLLETARFSAALEQAGPDAERLGADRDALAARAAALRERAAALAAPVIPDDDRARLAQGIATPPSVPLPADDPVPAQPDANP